MFLKKKKKNFLKRNEKPRNTENIFTWMKEYQRRLKHIFNNRLEIRNSKIQQAIILISLSDIFWKEEKNIFDLLLAK